MTMRCIAGIGEIAAGFDALILDQFGVLHDGTSAYPQARHCVERLAAAGKRLVVLSNSGRRAAENRARLVALGFRSADFHAVLTSGEVVWQALAGRSDAFHRALGSRCYVVSESGEEFFLAGRALQPTGSVDAADFVLVLGIEDRKSVV